MFKIYLLYYIKALPYLKTFSSKQRSLNQIKLFADKETLLSPNRTAMKPLT